MRARHLVAWLCCVAVGMVCGPVIAARSIPAQAGALTTRVSIAGDGTEGNGASRHSLVSQDGRYVVFVSEAGNLVPGDTNGVADVFVHDRTLGTTTRVSVSSNGTEGDGPSGSWEGLAISADCRYIAFPSEATNLVPGDTNGCTDVFVHDRDSGQTTRVSVASDGTEGHFASTRPSISGDGRYVAFGSYAMNLAPGFTDDPPMEADPEEWQYYSSAVFVHDRLTGETTFIGVPSARQRRHAHSPSISADGRYVAFQFGGNDGGPDEGFNLWDVYIRDLVTGETICASVSDGGEVGDGDSDHPSLSGDGRYVAFQSIASNLVPWGNTSGTPHVYVHDRITRRTTQVSVGSDGTMGDGPCEEPMISADGRYVVFQSMATNLVAGDTNGEMDIFVHDRLMSRTTRVSVGADGSQDQFGSFFPSIGGAGRYVSFASRSRTLVEGDTNEVEDIFLHDREGVPNTPPAAPTLLQPAADTLVDAAPLQLLLSGTDADPGAGLKFQVQLRRDGQVVVALDQLTDADPWNLGAVAYASGEIATAIVPDALDDGVYQWRARAFDGSAWGPWSALTQFSYRPEITWTMLEPQGQVVQRPLFLFRAGGAGDPGSERFHAMVEVSGSPDFQELLVTFDQSADANGWGQPDFGWGELIGMGTDYPSLPPYQTLYWRPRVRSVAGGAWSNPGPATAFRIVSGFEWIPPRELRMGRTMQTFITLTNPYTVPIDYVMSFDLARNTTDIGGTARLVDADGAVLDEVQIGEGPVQFMTPPLEQGRHVYTLEVMVGPGETAQAGGVSPSVAPAVIVGGKIIAGVIAGYLLEKACSAAVRAYLGKDLGLTDFESKTFLGVLQDTGIGIIAAEGAERAVTTTVIKTLENRGYKDLATKLATKVGVKGLPFIGTAMSIASCGQGVLEGIYGPDSYDVPVVASMDPNEKIGILGRNGYVLSGEPLPYQVLFENLPTATAAAQEVFITDVLDADVDLDAFEFTAVNFGTHTLTFPEGTREIARQVVLAPDKVVHIQGALDVQTRTVTVSFRALDPATGLLHDDGFLPPNTTPREGEGYVAFRTMVPEDATSGTEISNTATIVFDVNEPIVTNTVTVTVDVDPPQSRVLQLDAVQQSASFDVSWEFFDELSGTRYVRLWFSEEAEAGGAASPAATVILDRDAFKLYGTYQDVSSVQFEGKPGHRYRFYTVANDVVGNIEAPPDVADAQTVVVVEQLQTTFPAGISMVSVPLAPAVADPAELGFQGARWARWAPEAGAYVYYDADEERYTWFDPPARAVGKGYWACFEQEASVAVAGALHDNTSEHVVAIDPGPSGGWVQIGCPRAVDVPWMTSGTDAIRVRRGGQDLSLAEATAAGWCEDFAWGYAPGVGYDLVRDPADYSVSGRDVLEPWQGYWMKFSSACDLVFPRVGVAPGAVGGRPALQSGPGAWALAVCATAATGAASQAVIGQADDSRRIEAPPPFVQFVQMTVVEVGRRLGVDLRRPGASNAWTLDVQTDLGETEITLSWPDLSSVPLGLRPVLTDTQTGRRCYMRTSTGYAFTSAAGGEVRSFLLEMVPADQHVAATATVSAAQTGGGQVDIRVNLSAAATLDVEILNIAGRKVADVCVARAFEQGIATFTYSGAGNQGARLPSGRYLVRVRARTEDGQQTHAMAAFLLGR